MNEEKHKKLQKYTKLYFWQKVAVHVFRTVLLVGLIYVLIYPILYIFSTSLKSASDLADTTTIWIPKAPTVQTYKDAFNAINYMQGLKNSLIISVLSCLFQMASCALVGYGLARFQFREKKTIMVLILLTLIIPPETIILPQFIQFKDFDIFHIMHLITGHGINLLDTYVPFVLPTVFAFGLKSGFFIYIFMQFFRGMPRELEEAAYMDGCTPFKTFTKIMLPNAKPALLTVFLFSFVWHWNDVFEPSMYLTSDEKYSLSMKLIGIIGYIVKGQQVNDMTFLVPTKYAGIMLTILPMIILYAIGQKYFVEGVERSGIVG